MFAYRADYVTRAIFGRIKKTYRIAIGDFAGELSDMLGDEKAVKRIYDTTFFKWVMEADAFIFVIDYGAYVRSGDHYLARLEAEFRGAWQRLVEFHIEGKKSIRNKKVALVVNKSDLFIHILRDRAETRFFEPKNYASDSEPSGSDPLWSLGFGDEIPLPISVTREENLALRRNANTEFKSLIEYFNVQSNNVAVIPTSSFALYDNKPWGVDELVKFILPS